MDFFKSVFADEPDSPKSESKSSSDQPPLDSDPSSPPKLPNPNLDHTDAGTSTAAAGGGGGWSFGGLIKNLSIKSESVIEIYRRDLEEFGSGLKKEIEVAHGSLETVGNAIDEVGSSVLKSTAQIISQGKEAILSVDHESDSSDNDNKRSITSQQSLISKPYSRFDAQVRAIQGDESTYTEESQDLDDYKKWKSGFDLEEKREEVENLLQENGAVESIYKRLVPNSVDEETFWSRYYFKLYKLKQAEDVRANIVKRAISTEEEDLSWEFDDDEDEKEDERNATSKANLLENDDLGSKDSTKVTKDEEKDVHYKQSEQIVKGDEINKADSGESEQTVSMKGEISVVESKGETIFSGGDKDNVASDKVDLEKSKEETLSKSDEKWGLEGKGDNGESSKESDVSVISSHLSMPEEEDLEWDEIEDLSSIDEKKVSYTGSPNKNDLRKQLSAAEEEEDLSWDIEDDDEPVKS
ncbi:BSD domain-containing protein 1 [Manihot esculenta]|uniref:BSD domain-containing protein n=1 Tax=Manihot esculenta TaxID=3983 RepID=A0A2C9WMK8_MANES|nr:BSD domain-containing protein 1 [Manihot esculenta]OAY61711.1 hypothetical protein MANES_01G211100v8 [Manihot esculenta]